MPKHKKLPVAPANALLNIFLSIDCPRLTIVFVTVVPIFAPIIIQMAGFSVTTAERENCCVNCESIGCYGVAMGIETVE